MLYSATQRRFIRPIIANIGAGGNWSFEHELPDLSMEMQIGPFHCFAACAVTVLQHSGILVTQIQIANAINVPTTWGDIMTNELNMRDPHFSWDRDWFDPDYPDEAAAFLRVRLPAIILLKDLGNQYLHAVVLDAVGPHNRWLIRDPWNTNGCATRYLMNYHAISDPHHGWTGLVVYREKRKAKNSLRRK